MEIQFADSFPPYGETYGVLRRCVTQIEGSKGYGNKSAMLARHELLKTIRTFSMNEDI
jgi:hypothetical protein